MSQDYWEAAESLTTRIAQKLSVNWDVSKVSCCFEKLTNSWQFSNVSIAPAPLTWLDVNFIDVSMKSVDGFEWKVKFDSVVQVNCLIGLDIDGFAREAVVSDRVKKLGPVLGLALQLNGQVGQGRGHSQIFEVVLDESKPPRTADVFKLKLNKPVNVLYRRLKEVEDLKE